LLVYSVAEMEGWKAGQRASAGAGTPLTEGDGRSYARLSTDEQKVIMDVARIADRVITACRVAQGAIDALREAQEEKRHSSAWKRGPVYEVHDDGTRVLLNDRMQLPYVEQQEWAAKEHAAVEAEHPRIRQALSDLSGEVSVLRMMSAPLGRHAQQLQDAATRVLYAVGDSAAVGRAVSDVEALTSRLWRVANGEEDAAEAGTG
jgi:hypothetical protein